MKLKYYLRGLGIGILVTTVIFMIGIKTNTKNLISDQEVISRAEKLGMVMGESDGKSKTLEELEGQKKSEAQPDQTDAGQQKADTSKEDTKKETSKKEKDKTQDQKSVEKIEQVEISILPGEYSDAICQKLLTAGIIEDKDDYKNFLDSSGYDNLIQPGTFTIPKGSDYETIANILTTKQEFR